MKKKKNLFLINNIVLKENFYKYKQYKTLFFENCWVGNMGGIESFYYTNFLIKKSFFIGLLIGFSKKNQNSSIFLRNVLGKYLVESKYKIYNPLVYSFRKSKKSIFNFKKSKLYFITNLPFLFRANKVVLKELSFSKKIKNAK